MVFRTRDGASEDLKIILDAIENLSLPLDRAHRVVLGTLIGTVGTCSWANLC